MARPPLPLGSWGAISRVEVSAGRWRARARYRDFDGRTRTVERFGKTGAAAERHLRDALATRAAPARGDVIDRTTTINDLARLWLAGMGADGHHSDTTLGLYESAIAVHIVPALGDVRVGEVTVGLLDRFLRARKTPSVAKRCRVVLTAMMALAARHDAIDHNPVRETASRAPTKSVVRAMTVDEVAELRALVAGWAGGNNHGPPRALDLPEILDVMIGTGARIGEVLAIRCDDLDLDATPPTVTITGTIVRNRRQGHGKTSASRRQVAIPAFTVAALRRQLARDLPAEDGLVFPSRSGGPRTTHNVRRQLREARGDDFDWVSPHVFRKTVATAIERSADIEAAAAQLGHAGPDVTRAHYVEKTGVAPDMRHVLERFSPVSRGFSVGGAG